MEALFGNTLFWAFWIFLPAGIANMTPPLANKVPFLNKWNTPLDLNIRFLGKRVFGDHKTWRGVLTGVSMAALVSWLQFFVMHGYYSINSSLIFVIFGVIMGLGALFGDALESFFKRQLSIKSGHSWFPFDQADYIIGGLVFTYPIAHWPVSVMLWIFLIYFGLHLAVSYVGYLLGFKDKPI